MKPRKTSERKTNLLDSRVIRARVEQHSNWYVTNLEDPHILAAWNLAQDGDVKQLVDLAAEALRAKDQKTSKRVVPLKNKAWKFFQQLHDNGIRMPDKPAAKQLLEILSKKGVDTSSFELSTVRDWLTKTFGPKRGASWRGSPSAKEWDRTFRIPHLHAWLRKYNSGHYIKLYKAKYNKPPIENW